MEFILSNRPLLAATLAMLSAQFLKPFILWSIEKEFDYRLFFTTGGMPSSHTATVVALTTSIAIHDAMGIRRAAGKQAEVINEWSRILSKVHQDGQFTPENLKTMLGHSFVQVLAGTLMGLLYGYIFTVVL